MNLIEWLDLILVIEVGVNTGLMILMLKKMEAQHG